MRIADSVYVLPIPRGSRGTDGFLNLTLILDEQYSNMLIDAGSPGHLSLYLERPKVLVAGVALTAEEGHLNGPNAPLTLDVREAARSVRRLADPEIDTIVCYHDGVVGE